jgi:hypothetical protein
MNEKHSPRILVAAVAAVSWLCVAQSAFAGTIVGWGCNDYGEATPPDGNDFVAISAGGSYSLALRSDGSILGWGYNASGQATPPSSSECVAIAARSYHSLAIREPCQYVLAGDLNNNCRVNLRDFAQMLENWLINCRLDPSNPACTPK